MDINEAQRLIRETPRGFGSALCANAWNAATAMCDRVAELESAHLPETAGEAPPFTIFAIIDNGFGDSSYLVHVDGRHLPVFHIRDNIWGRWCHQGPRVCEWPDQRIAVQVCNARGLKIAADQHGKGES